MSLFGKNIKKIRNVRGLTQMQLADLIDVSRGVISSYEEGRAEPKIETIIKTADIFNLSIDQLLKTNVTVNQLSGFTVPEIHNKNDNNISIPQAIQQFSEKTLVPITVSSVNYIDIFANEDILFVSPSPIQSEKLMYFKTSQDSFVCKPIFVSQDTLLLLGKEKAIKEIEESYEIVGVYRKVTNNETVEERLNRLEKKINEIQNQVYK